MFGLGFGIKRLIDAYAAADFFELYKISQFGDHPLQIEQLPLLSIVVWVLVEVLLEIGHEIDDRNSRSLGVDKVILDEASVLR
jgi:hypothetical protein